MLIHMIFVSRVTVRCTAFGDEDVPLQAPSPRDAIFMFIECPLADRFIELITLLTTNEKIVGVELPNEASTKPHQRTSYANSKPVRGVAVQRREFSTRAGPTPKIKFKVSNVEVWVHTLEEMKVILNEMCFIKDGIYVLKE